MPKRGKKSGGVLTLDILNEAIDRIKQSERKVIGLRINPADLREITEGKIVYCGVVNRSLVMIPPYQDLRLESDVNQPRGCVSSIYEDRR